jgi:hypothetical protein
MQTQCPAVGCTNLTINCQTCINHKCTYTGCNYPAVKDKNKCTFHTCTWQSCDNIKYTGSHHCINHKCKSCTSARCSEKTEYCYYHKCKHCDNTLTCVTHTCTSCKYRPLVNNTTFCDLCRCIVPYCYRSRNKHVYPATYCEYHKYVGVQVQNPIQMPIQNPIQAPIQNPVHE